MIIYTLVQSFQITETWRLGVKKKLPNEMFWFTEASRTVRQNPTKGRVGFSEILQYAKFCPPPPCYSGGLQNGITFFLLSPC